MSSGVSAIVLAAGFSRRMGSKNKLLMSINGRPMIDQVLEQVAESSCGELVVVSSPSTASSLPENYRLAINDQPDQGMTSSIQTGVQHCARDATGFMICLGDQPFISSFEYDAIINAFTNHHEQDPKTIAVPYFEGKRGNPTIFAASYGPEILKHREPEGCRSIVAQNRGHWLRIDMNSPSILIDIDTMEDYQSLS
ncbi:MAG: nucleotidyltransferase family protein [Bacteroidota bacterium]